jgi:serine/threonine protein kinase
MLTGQSLWHADTNDNLASISDLEILSKWPDDIKNQRLSLIRNREAKSLLSLLLYKDPNKRPSMTRILTHAFLTGKQSTRLPTEEALYDVFLSYRKASDSYHVKELASRLSSTGLRVWWDTELVPGQNWLLNFCKALASTKVFVPLISRGAVNATNEKNEAIYGRHWSSLSYDSSCDNVFLEWRLACELKAKGLLEGTVPVWIGDKDNETNIYMVISLNKVVVL